MRLKERLTDEQWDQIVHNFTVSKEAEKQAEKALEDAFERYHE